MELKLKEARELKLKEAREYAKTAREESSIVALYEDEELIIVLDDRITELEAERDVYKNRLELMEADRNDLRKHVRDLAELVKEMS